MEYCLTLVIQCLSLLLILSSTTSLSKTIHKIPRLTPFYASILRQRDSSSSATQVLLSPDFRTYYYDQTLDHFNYRSQSYDTFKQRYIVNSKFWGGAQFNSPIFAWLGAETPINYDPIGVGFLTDNAPGFKALLVYIEHRYYGESIPFGNMEEALRNETIRGYLNSAQALADYAELLLYIKNTYSAQDSPIIVVGGSYGGMLASWFRLKYPHIALGALASSAPILYFDNITPQNGYYSVVTKDFREVSESCYQTIKQSWSIIDTIASQSNGLSILSRKFNLCQDLTSSWELKNYLNSIYAEAAQYDAPPKYPVTEVCGGIDGAPKGADILDRIHAGVVSRRGNQSCYSRLYTGIDISGWRWQTCSEMVIPIGRDSGDTMFYPAPFDLQQFSQYCINLFHVPPRPHWITTYYGGHDIKLALSKFGSNIIFSNGLRDPYSSGGVLENISDTILAVSTRNGSHCLDLLGERETDPDWTTSATSDTQFKTYYYNQTLDHFNYGPQSYATFKHRYIVNSNFWGGAQSNSPIFAWLGAESSIDSDPQGIGFLTDNAPRFKALLVYIEHRYYGESIPFGTMEKAMDDDTTRGYFNSAQALADYAEYPHVSLGALASSAPVLYFDDITPQDGYYSIVTKDFREVSESCYQTIKESWSIIDKIASKPYGLSILRGKFKLCQDLNSSWELKDYLDEIYCEAAQYNSPPEYLVTVVCGGIDGAPKGAHILDRIHAGVVASEGNQPCYDVSAGETPRASPGEDDEIWGWNWQTCSELVIPIAKGNDSMFNPAPFNLQRYSQFCIDNFGVPPRPHWVTTYYGGHDIKFVLRNFGSNIIFSNGLRDPYSIAGVLENISDTILAVYTQNGSHCLDLDGERATDPNWLTEQRNKEIEIIQGWITKYYADLQALKK
nr:lysosomal Pro-X carboxypeptidase-like [Ipomoea trifida]